MREEPEPLRPRGTAVLAKRPGLHHRRIQAGLRDDVLIAALSQITDRVVPDPLLKAITARRDL